MFKQKTVQTPPHVTSLAKDLKPNVTKMRV